MQLLKGTEVSCDSCFLSSQHTQSETYFEKLNFGYSAVHAYAGNGLLNLVQFTSKQAQSCLWASHDSCLQDSHPVGH